ncbi:MAG: helix-turn-helix domain-containing protein [Candidatus Syntropharchaeia archaeon]
MEEKYRKERDPRVKERLLAILLLYDGKNIYKVSEIIRRSERAIKVWMKGLNYSVISRAAYEISSIYRT